MLANAPYSYPRLWKRRLTAFTKNKDGAVAVEFALVAAPFFILLFGLLEISLLFFMSTMLDYGVSAASREIRTGEIQTEGGLKDDFAELVCGNLFNLFDCKNNLYIDVRTYDDFVASNAGDGLPLDKDGNIIDNFKFNPGGASDIVLVQAYYEWKMITPGISSALVNMKGGKRLISSATVFRNEPF